MNPPPSPPSLRPRASSSASSERSSSPLLMNSTQSLDPMPRFSFSTEDDGETQTCIHTHTRTYTHVHTHTHKCTHTQTHQCVTTLSSDGVVSNLRRIRLRSNSTGTRPSYRRGASRRITNQLDAPEKPRPPVSCKVPKSASVSSLSLVITTGN